MNIGIYDPYLNTLGGGERYILEIASCLSKDNTIKLFWDGESVLSLVKDKFNIDVSKIELTPNIFSPSISLLSRVKKSRKYDLIIYVSDGSIPTLFAKKNILLFQFPVNWINTNNFITSLKLKKINKIICYTDFVKKHLEKKFRIPIKVIYPLVKIEPKKIQKENIILNVGRFAKHMNAKKQEILIEEFKKLTEKELKSWRFLLIGSYLEQDSDFVEDLKKKAKGYPIDIITNLSYKELVSYYSVAKIYWHATGFGEDLEKHPERAEHFGITTVEAMGAGAVPVVINAGGQREIVQDGKSGFLWNTTNELEEKTMELIGDQKLWKTMSEEAKIRAQFFAGDRFCKELKEIIK